jgi:hypothetical protein
VAAEAAMALGFLAFAGRDRPRSGSCWPRRWLAAVVRVFWCTIFTLVADYADGRPGGGGVDTWVRDQQRGPHGRGLALGGDSSTWASWSGTGSAAGYRRGGQRRRGCTWALAAVLVAVRQCAPAHSAACHRRHRPRSGAPASC